MPIDDPQLEADRVFTDAQRNVAKREQARKTPGGRSTKQGFNPKTGEVRREKRKSKRRLKSSRVGGGGGALPDVNGTPKKPRGARTGLRMF
ncbi:MAG: hypothetical protein GY906_23185 [bacterium]|nr:hypothetical protein [bacterium]